MNKYYLVIIALLFMGGSVQAQKKEPQKVVKPVVKTESKAGQPLPSEPSEQTRSRLPDSTLSKIQEQLHGRNLRKNKMDLSLMAEPYRPIL